MTNPDARFDFLTLGPEFSAPPWSPRRRIESTELSWDLTGFRSFTSNYFKKAHIQIANCGMDIHATTTRTRRALLVLCTSVLVYGCISDESVEPDYGLSVVALPALLECGLSFVDLAIVMFGCSDNKPSCNMIVHLLVLCGATCSAALLYAQLDDEIDTHYTLIAAPITAGLLMSVALQSVKAWKWVQRTGFEPLPPCGSSAGNSCFDSWVEHASSIPLDRYCAATPPLSLGCSYHYQACGQSVTAAGYPRVIHFLELCAVLRFL